LLLLSDKAVNQEHIYIFVVINFTDWALWTVQIQNKLIKLQILLDILLGLLGWGIGSSLGLYLHSTALGGVEV